MDKLMQSLLGALGLAFLKQLDQVIEGSHKDPDKILKEAREFIKQMNYQVSSGVSEELENNPQAKKVIDEINKRLEERDRVAA